MLRARCSSAVAWPCRLFEVEPRGELVSDGSHKHGCAAVKVVRELPAWQALGPNGEAVADVIERCKTLTDEQAKHLAAARAATPLGTPLGPPLGTPLGTPLGPPLGTPLWDAARAAAWAAARDAAWDAAWDAARAAARDAAWDAARDAARDAALALLVHDLITAEQFDLLYGPWQSVMG